MKIEAEQYCGNGRQYSDLVRAQFNLRARHYDFATAWRTDPALIRTLTQTNRLNKNTLGLDLGGGTGTVAKALSTIANMGKWILQDVSEQMIIRSAHRPSVIGDAQKLPFQSQVFDAVVMRSLLAYINSELVTHECLRVLGKYGIVIILEKVIDLWQKSRDAERWIRMLEQLRNPLRKPLRTTRELESIFRRPSFDIVSSQRLYRLYKQPTDEWLEAVPSSAGVRNQLIRLFSHAPKSVRDLGFNTSGGILQFPVSWAFIVAVPAMSRPR